MKDSATVESRNLGKASSACETYCSECEKGPFKGERGLSQHKRLAHAEQWNREVEERDRSSRKLVRLTDEELYVVAKEYAKISSGISRAAACKKLNEIFPARTVESFKKILVNPRFLKILEGSQSPQGVLSATVEVAEEVVEIRDDSEAGLKEAVVKLRNSFFGELPSLDVASLSNFIDTECDSWLDSLEKQPEKVIRKRVIEVEPLKNVSRKRLRRAAFGRIQRLYKKERSAAAEVVLSGKWNGPPLRSRIGHKRMFREWRKVLEHPSVKDDRELSSKEVLDDLLEPIRQIEVEKARKGTKVSAAGPDRVAYEVVKAIKVDTLVAHFNLWLLGERLPKSMNVARTIFIPKVDNASALEHRPISICSHISRLFHKVLANRMEREVPLSHRQKGFRKVDGVGANLTVLRNLFDHAKRERKPISLCFLDIRKAFDSVSHESVRVALSAKGVPAKLRRYIEWVYREATTVLEFGGEKSEVIKLGRGVRQGDPLSPILFNLALDLVLSSLPEELGFEIGGERVNYLSYADDTVLVAKTELGIESLTNSFVEESAKCGLELNSAKCVSLSLCLTKKDRTIYYSTAPFVLANGEQIPRLNLMTGYKYLGIMFSASWNRSQAFEKLQAGLDNLTRAPLKPQQRLFLLRVFLIPKLIHGLVFTNMTMKGLKGLDLMVREACRNWLKWPKDAPLGLFYCAVHQGGLGLPCLVDNVRF